MALEVRSGAILITNEEPVTRASTRVTGGKNGCRQRWQQPASWTPPFVATFRQPLSQPCKKMQGKGFCHVKVASFTGLFSAFLAKRANPRPQESKGGQRKMLAVAEARGLQGIRDGLAAAHAGYDILTGEAWVPLMEDENVDPPSG